MKRALALPKFFCAGFRYDHQVPRKNMSPPPTTSKYFAKNGGAARGEKQTTGYSLRTRRNIPAAAAAVTLVAATSTSPFIDALTTPSRKGKRKPAPSVTPDPADSNAMFLAKPKQAVKKFAKKKKTAVARTESFSAIWAGRYSEDEALNNVKPHTLILGTHPSIASLDKQQYYGHPMK